MARPEKMNQQGKRSRGLRNADRPRPLPPDVTARNLAYEKERRRALNDDFVSLARLVPALAGAKRLNKNLIVKESIQHLHRRRELCILAARDMQHILAENERLRVEVHALREQQGEPASPTVGVSPVTEAMTQLMNVENEICSEFPPGFGENWAGRPRSGSSSSNADHSRAHDQTASSSPPEESNHQPTQFQDAHNASAMATNPDLLQMSNTEFQVSDTWDMALPVESQAPLLAAPDMDAFPPPTSNEPLFIPLQNPDPTLLDNSLPVMDFSVGRWVEDAELPYDWPSSLHQHLDFPVI